TQLQERSRPRSARLEAAHRSAGGHTPRDGREQPQRIGIGSGLSRPLDGSRHYGSVGLRRPKLLMKVLAITNLFPNPLEPDRGCFNLKQFQRLQRHCELRVIAPIAWKPWRRAMQRAVPDETDWNGVRVTYPFYFYTPGIGRAAYAAWMYGSLRET